MRNQQIRCLPRGNRIAGFLKNALCLLAGHPEWFGGFGTALLAIALALLAFHYYLMPPINSFTWKHDLFAVGISEVPRLFLFSITSFVVSSMISAQRRAKAALLHSEVYLTEAQRLSGTGSFGWDVASVEIIWSDQTFL